MASKIYIIAVLMMIGVANASIFTLTSRDSSAVNSLDGHIENLQQIAKQASDSAAEFTQQVQKQQEEAMANFQNQLSSIQANISAAVSNATSAVQNSASDVASKFTKCIEDNQQQSQDLFSNAMNDVVSCFTDRIDSIINKIGQLMELSNEASTAAQELASEAQKCNENPMAAFFCLANLGFKASVKAATIGFNSAIVTSQLSFAIPTIPQALQICIATKFAEATIQAGKIVFDIASCTIQG